MRNAFTSATGALALAAGLSLLGATSAAAGGCVGDCYRYANHPPVYGSVSEQVLVRPPQTVHETIPPVFDTVSEPVLVEPGRRVWQTSYDHHGQPVGCWVTLPPRYATQTRRVLVRPAQVVPHVVPAAYASYQRSVLVSPGHAGWEPIGRGGYGGGYGGYGGHGRSGAFVGGSGFGSSILDAPGALVAKGFGSSLLGSGPYGEGY